MKKAQEIAEFFSGQINGCKTGIMTVKKLEKQRLNLSIFNGCATNENAPFYA